MNRTQRSQNICFGGFDTICFIYIVQIRLIQENLNQVCLKVETETILETQNLSTVRPNPPMFIQEIPIELMP